MFCKLEKYVENTKCLAAALILITFQILYLLINYVHLRLVQKSPLVTHDLINRIGTSYLTKKISHHLQQLVVLDICF